MGVQADERASRQRLAGPERTEGASSQVSGSASAPAAMPCAYPPAAAKPSPGHLALVIVGLAFLWPCLGSFVTMRFRHVMAGSASLITTDWHAVVMSVIYLVAIVLCLVRRRQINSILAGDKAKLLALATGAIGLVGHIFLILSSLVTSAAALATALVLVGFILTIVFIVAHVLTWGSVLTRFSGARLLAVIAASLALSYALQAGLDAIPGNALLSYLLVCPAGSTILLVAALRLGVGAPSPAGTAPTADSDAGAPSTAKTTGFPGLSWRFIVPTVVLFYFEQAFSSMLFQRFPGWPHDYLSVSLVTCCLIWLVLALYAFWKLSRPDSRAPMGAPAQQDTRLLLGSFIPLVVVYMAALLVTVLFPSSDVQVPERFLVAAGSCLRYFLWVIVAFDVAARRSDVVSGYLVFIGLNLMVPISRLTAMAYALLSPQTLATLTSPQVIVPIAAVMLFLIAVVFLLSSARETNRVLDQVAHELAEETASASGWPGDTAGVRAAATAADAVEAGPSPEQLAAAESQSYERVAAEAGLTKREAEVLVLICHGYSARGMGERLGISESTAISHTTHIYRKFGVSSKQALIAQVERRRGLRDKG